MVLECIFVLGSTLTERRASLHVGSARAQFISLDHTTARAVPTRKVPTHTPVTLLHAGVNQNPDGVLPSTRITCYLSFQESVQCVERKYWTPRTTSRHLCERRSEAGIQVVSYVLPSLPSHKHL